MPVKTPKPRQITLSEVVRHTNATVQDADRPLLNTLVAFRETDEWYERLCEVHKRAPRASEASLARTIFRTGILAMEQAIADGLL